MRSNIDLWVISLMVGVGKIARIARLIHIMDDDAEKHLPSSDKITLCIKGIVFDLYMISRSFGVNLADIVNEIPNQGEGS